MRAVAILVVATAVAVILQTTILQALPYVSVVPDILLVLCVYLGLYQHNVGGAFGAFILGYLEDGVSGSAAGLNAFAMSLIFLLIYLTSRRLWVENVISQVVVVFLAFMVKAAAVTILLAIFASFDSGWGLVVGSLFLQGLVTAAAAPIVFALLKRTRRPSEAFAR